MQLKLYKKQLKIGSAQPAKKDIILFREEDIMNLSENLKNIRKTNGLSQEAFAESLGVSRQSVSKWELGEAYPEMEKMLKICEIYKCNINELLNENIIDKNDNIKTKNKFKESVNNLLDFIYEIFNMFISFSFKQKVRFILELIFINIILILMYEVVMNVGYNIFMSIFSFMGNTAINIYIYDVLLALFRLISLIFSVYVSILVIKKRYLAYFEIAVKEKIEPNNLKKEPSIINNEGKNVTMASERIIIRDPNISYNRFLNGISNVVIFLIKAFMIFISLFFIFLFISGFTLIPCLFLIAKSGLTFVGLLLLALGIIGINFVFLYLIYIFVFNKTIKKKFVGIFLLSAFVISGIGIGLFLADIPNYDTSLDGRLEKEYVFDVKKNYCVCYDEFVLSDEYNEGFKVVVDLPINQNNDIEYARNGQYIYINFLSLTYNPMDVINRIIEGINKKKMQYLNFNSYVTIYANEQTIKKINDNCNDYFNSMQERIEDNFNDDRNSFDVFE